MPSVPHTPRVVHPVNPPDKRMNAHETVRAESLQDAANKGTWKYGQSAGGGWRCESVNVTACSRGNFLVSYGFARPASPDWLFLIRNGFVSANEVRREAATPVPERTTHRCYTLAPRALMPWWGWCIVAYLAGFLWANWPAIKGAM
jgi:hypothetical protein